jgi:large subunit ribosomal protein L2
MKIIKLNPTTNGTRHQIKLQNFLLSKTNNLIKKSTTGFKRFNGRSSVTGRITVRHKGNGCKKKYRNITFSNQKYFSIVVTTVHDPFRNAFVALCFDLDRNTFFFSLSTNFVYPGSILICNSEQTELKLGYRTLLKNIPAGSIIHSLSLGLKHKIKFARSAGTSCQIVQKTIKNCCVRLPSGNLFDVSMNAFATIGILSNFQHNKIVIGKAGKNRLAGKRPSVRGIAMNPVDHPHGGRTNGGQPSVTPWGIPTKGKPTVKKKL